jgi:hypothetical protein
MVMWKNLSYFQSFQIVDHRFEGLFAKHAAAILIETSQELLEVDILDSI